MRSRVAKGSLFLPMLFGANCANLDLLVSLASEFQLSNAAVSETGKTEEISFWLYVEFPRKLGLKGL